MRLLGLEYGSLEAVGPKCQRYAAVVEDGVLLKLVGGMLLMYGRMLHIRTSGPSILGAQAGGWIVWGYASHSHFR